MKRIDPLEPPYEPEVDRTLGRMMGASGIELLKLFRTVAHNPHVLERFRSAGSYFLNFGTLEPLDRELVIHRTCARCGSEYEWGCTLTSTDARSASQTINWRPPSTVQRTMVSGLSAKGC